MRPNKQTDDDEKGKTLSVFQMDRKEKESGERLRERELGEELQTKNKRRKKRIDREFLLPPSHPSRRG